MIILKGNEIKKRWIEELKEKLTTSINFNILRIKGDTPRDIEAFNSSIHYINGIKDVASQIGIHVHVHDIKDISCLQRSLSHIIRTEQRQVGRNVRVIVKPLPENFDEHMAFSITQQYLDRANDVDCISADMMGLFHTGVKNIAPATPTAIMKMLEGHDISVAGKTVCIIGRSNVIGRPMAELILRADGTPIICHTKTKELPRLCKSADIIISGAGTPNLIDDTMVTKNSIVIDAGLEVVNGKIVGDVNRDKVGEIPYALSPVPGGVGALTTVALMANALNI